MATLSYRPPPTSFLRAPGDRYLIVLGAVLMGYALFGRSFAYVGVPPLFIGEMLLGAGLLLLALSRWPKALFRSPPLVGVAFLLAWVIVRTVPYVGEYGLDAVRDAFVAVYALFAFIMVGLLVQRPERLAEMLTRYRIQVVVTCAVAWALYLITRSFQDALPTLPWAPHVHLIENKPGDLAVHMAGITAFVLLGWRRPAVWLFSLMVVGSAAVMVGNRGGMVGYLLAMVVFGVLRPPGVRFGKLLYGAVLLVLLGLVVDTSNLQTNEGSRSVSVEQLWENVKSIFGQSDNYMLSTTTEWRKIWWGRIADYTIHGEYFWTGKGFGRNIATEDGFQIDEAESLRSPHNVQMTLLARAGVPGLALWIVTHALWWLTLLRGWAYARRHGLAAWQGFFAFCSVYWVAPVLNATFDVYLEGPMGAIWFWVVFGGAIAGERLVRSHPTLLDGLPATAPPPSPPAPTWGWSAGDGAATVVPTASPAAPAALPPPTWTPLGP